MGGTPINRVTGLLMGCCAIVVSGCFRTPLDDAKPTESDRPDSGADRTQVVGDGDALSSPPGDGSEVPKDGASSGCLIGGVLYMSGVANPVDSCQSCQPSASTSTWSNVAVVPGCIAGGGMHTCAVRGGAALCWGDNSDGQLGDGSVRQSRLPVQVQGLSSDVAAVAAGFLHSCAIVKGKVLCWGGNPSGELGNGTTTDSSVPTKVVDLQGSVQVVAAGELHTCALAGTTVWCWGVNSGGALGAYVDYYSARPVQVQNLPSGIRLLAAGTSHTCASTDSGVWCWGDNTFGQLGHPPVNAREFSLVPVQVPGVTGPIRGLTAGDHFTCALSQTAVACWGTNTPVGNGSPTSATVPSFPSDISFIAGRMGHLCGIRSGSGGVVCIGDGYYGDLGDGSQARPMGAVDVIASFSSTQSLGAGLYHTCAAATEGIWCWGSNSNGQLGDGSTHDNSVPVAVAGLP